MRTLFEARFHGGMTFIVEAKSIYDRALPLQPEYARFRITRLGPRRGGADFRKAKAELQHGIRHFTVFVETCCDAKRIGEVHAEKVDPKRHRVRFTTRTQSGFQRQQSCLVRLLRIHQAQEGQSEGREGHLPSPAATTWAGNWWVPSGPSGKSSTRATWLICSGP